MSVSSRVLPIRPAHASPASPSRTSHLQLAIARLVAIAALVAVDILFVLAMTGAVPTGSTGGRDLGSPSPAPAPAVIAQPSR